MPAVIGSALLILGASVITGRALLLAFGRARPSWLQGSIGFALLVVLAPLLIRLPGRATTATIIIALLLIAALAVMRRGFFAAGSKDGAAKEGGASGAGGKRTTHSHIAALATVL